MGKRSSERNFLFGVFAISLALKLYLVFTDLHLIHPDEQFQTLEPASALALGYGWKSWEWYHGTRSWIVPGIYAPLFWLLKLLGWDGGVAAIRGAKILNLIFESVFVIQLWRTLLNWQIPEWIRKTILVLWLLLPATLNWSVTTFSDNLAMLIVWSAVPLAWVAMEKSKSARRSALLWGLLLGLSAAIRVQMLAFVAGLGILFLLARRLRPNSASFYAGVGISLLLSGILDWMTWGTPFQSSVKNIRMNLIEGVASSNGVSPWYEYFSLLGNNFSWVFWSIWTGILIWALVIGQKLRGTLQEALLFVPALIFFLAHTLIGHKELRFLLPIYPCIFLILAWALRRIFSKSKASAFRWLPASLSLFLVTANLFLWTAKDSRKSLDLSPLLLQIRSDGAFQQAPESCLYLVNHYWIWTRGELLFSQKIRFVESKAPDYQPKALGECAYALIPRSAEQDFLTAAKQHAAHAAWRRIDNMALGMIAMKNSEVAGDKNQ